MFVEEEDEATRLALESLGSRVASTSTYEASVIRDATLSSAPAFSGVGFPDLRTLAPSFNAKTEQGNFESDIPHIKKVLTRTQSVLKDLYESDPSQLETKEANLLRMKVQILTSFLQMHSDVHTISKEEWFSIKNFQRTEDKNRSLALCSSSKVSSLSRDELQAKHDKKKSKRMKLKRRNSRFSKAQRLEDIKNGTVDDDSTEKNDSGNTLTVGAQLLRHRRKSMMEWKKIDREQIEEFNGEEDYWKEIYRQKQKRREARRERRRARQELLNSMTNETEIQHNDQSEHDMIKEEDDEEFEFQDEDNVTEMRVESVNGKIEENNNNVPSEAISQKDHYPDLIGSNSSIEKIKPDKILSTSNQMSEASVTCPLCQRSFTIPKSNRGKKASHVDADTFLSNHMDRCQRRGRKRKMIGTYNDDIVQEKQQQTCESTKEEHDNFDDVTNHDYTEEDTFTKNASSHTPKISAKNNSQSTSKSRDESNKRGLIVKKNKTKRFFVKKSIPSEKKYTSKPKNFSIDDYELPVYMDRVEDWIDDFIISAAASTESTKRQDLDEKPPGMAIYLPNLIVPAWINNKLFGYQRTGLKWMYELFQQESGGIVGDEMGLGKTVQICAFLQSMILSRQISNVLIVCPATLLIHWLQELAKWAPGLRRILIHKAGEKADGFTREISYKMLKTLDQWVESSRRQFLNEPLNEKDLEEEKKDVGLNDGAFCGSGYVVVTTFESIRRDSLTWTDHNWDYIILDEGQKIRNPDADITLACKRFKTSRRLLLSGTPIQNDLRELWSLFDFVFPGRLGTLPAFETEFADPIKKGGYSNASPMQIQLAYRCALVLRDLINPYLLRRQKKDVKEVSLLPGKTEQVLFCRLTNKQRSLYKSYLASDEVKRVIKGTIQSFRAITNLRKICNHPDLFGDTDDRFGNASSDSSSDEDVDSDRHYSDMTLIDQCGKLEVLAKILPLWHKQGHRVLLFCQWKKMLNIIQKFLMLHDWKFYRMDGNTNVSIRQKMVDSFNADKSYFLMLMTTKTGGVGLNLTGADRIIIYDPDWNPQTDIQARERSYRFGQKNHVTIYRLITAGTIEEKIYHRQIFKTAMSNQVLQDPKQRRLFTRKDLKDLFTLKEDVHSVQNGGEGFTETGRITKGDGVVKPEDMDKEVPKTARDNTETLNAVLRTKGLAGVFEHDSLGLSSAKKNIADLEMEEIAISEADKAAERLENSVQSPSNETEFIPTWTGSSETKQQRKRPTNNRSKKLALRESNENMFGRTESTQMRAGMFSSSNGESNFGDAEVVGATKSSAMTGQSSSVLLANLRRRRQQMMDLKNP